MTDIPVGTRRADGAWLIRNDVGPLAHRYGSWATLHRTDLLTLLHRALPPEVLQASVQVDQVRPDGTVVHTGGTSGADVVVGADGQRSGTRRSLWPDAVLQHDTYELPDLSTYAADRARRPRT
ncbi:hypothetical protein SAMN04489712_114160 [Thermomonospora echinospora]|uniref:FAD binding domain-containing protein n=1 Tax=Thermomonospora echinospora TaxID=1992 RepID=A0A1H6D985_9ACTN|nr:hypothetical protein [Thermomonospora echinospora]SEG81860.1 hypothetical protein SAMN04489712_114160 [Thermomonospora echinospora]